MKYDNETIDLSGRLKVLDHFTGVPHARPGSEADGVPPAGGPACRVLVPRRSRVFLLSRGRRGVFADVTLTAPLPRRSVE